MTNIKLSGNSRILVNMSLKDRTIWFSV